MAKKNFKTDISSGLDTLLSSTSASNEKPTKMEKQYVRYNYVIEKDIYKKLKIQSVKEERHIIEILRDALSSYLDNKNAI